MKSSAVDLKETTTYSFLVNGGVMATLIRNHEWASTSVGAVSSWPQSLRTALQIMLSLQQPAFIAWGKEMSLFYNDLLKNLIGDQHTGKPASAVWKNIELLQQEIDHTKKERSLLILETKDTSGTDHSFHCTALFNEEGKASGFFCTNTNEIDRVRKEAEQQFRQLFLQAPALIHIFKGPEHIIELFHPKGKAFVNRRDLTGMKLREATPELEGQGFFELLDDVYQNGKTYTLSETQVLLANENGELVERFFDLTYQPLYDNNSKIQGVMNFGVEVTETVTARRKIEESEAHFREMADSAPAIFWITDKDGSCTYLNQSWYEATGQKEEEALGLGWLNATHPHDLPKTSEIFHEANKNQIPFYAEYRLRYKDGAYRWVIDKGTPRFDDTGNFIGFIGAVVDVHERKVAELALEESEERQKLAVEASGMGTWVCDLETGMVHCSERTKEIFGYTETLVSLEYVFNTIHPHDQERIKQAVANAMQHKEGFYRAEYRVLNDLDRSVRSVIANGKIFFDDERKPVKFVGTCLDLTKQKEIEDSIRKSEERYRHIFEGTPISIWEEDFSWVKNEVERMKAKGISDFASYFKDHPQELQQLIQSVRINDVNESTLKLIEASSKEELKAGLQNIFVEDTTDAFISELGTIANGGGRFEYETVLQTLRGSRIDVLVHIDFPKHNNYSSVLVTLVDVSERRKADNILKESEEQFRLLAETLPQLVWVTDGEGNRLYASSRWQEFTGLVPGSDSWLNTMHPEDVDKVMEVWKESLTSGKSYRAELRLKSKSGDYYWFYMQGEPIRNEQVEIIKWIGSATNIQGQKEIEKHLEGLVSKRTEELQRSNKDLQQFAHVASHDLKEPLRKIKTFAGRLADDTETSFSEKGFAYLQKIDKASERMFMMIDGVLNYSAFNVAEQKAEPVNLNELMRNIEADLELVIQKKSATIIYNDLPIIQGASVLLHQLFYNLINNSLKFSKEEGAPFIQITSSLIINNEKQYAEINVKDNGIGFAQQFSEKIFDTFTRLNSKDLYEGTGLGLSLCKRIAERHGGNITANGEAGKGAEFIIQLPIRQEKHTL